MDLLPGGSGGLRDHQRPPEILAGAREVGPLGLVAQLGAQHPRGELQRGPVARRERRRLLRERDRARAARDAGLGEAGLGADLQLTERVDVREERLVVHLALVQPARGFEAVNARAEIDGARAVRAHVPAGHEAEEPLARVLEAPPAQERAHHRKLHRGARLGPAGQRGQAIPEIRGVLEQPRGHGALHRAAQPHARRLGRAEPLVAGGEEGRVRGRARARRDGVEQRAVEEREPWPPRRDPERRLPHHLLHEPDLVRRAGGREQPRRHQRLQRLLQPLVAAGRAQHLQPEPAARERRGREHAQRGALRRAPRRDVRGQAGLDQLRHARRLLAQRARVDGAPRAALPDDGPERAEGDERVHDEERHAPRSARDRLRQRGRERAHRLRELHRLALRQRREGEVHDLGAIPRAHAGEQRPQGGGRARLVARRRHHEEARLAARRGPVDEQP
ncbi:MAG: hypothetical protein QM820_05935 [Minicystis sp.]